MPVVSGSGGTPASSLSTLAQLINRLRTNALDRPPYDTLATAPLNATDVTSAFTVADGSQFKDRNIVDFDDGTFEACLCSVKATATTGTFVRGWESVVAAHAIGAPMRINPRYRAFQYREAINSSLRAIGAGFRRDVWDTTQSFNDSTRILPVPAAAVRFIELASDRSGEAITGLKRVPAKFMPSAPAAFSATGNAVALTGRNPGAGIAYIHYQDAWPLLVNAADTLDPDYPADAEDLVILGAECYLLDSDGFSLVAFQEPHVRQRQFGSREGDVHTEFVTKMQRFVQRRSEVASTRPQKNPSWLRGA